MRPLVLAVLVVLAGCSIPYQGTSFKAIPKPERMAEGEHHGTEGSGEEGEKKVGIAMRMYEGDAELNRGATMYGADQDDILPGSAEERVSLVFPKTAPPTEIPVRNGAGYGEGSSEAHSE